MATLSGSLDTFSPAEVLRLVASTGKTGMLWVEGSEVSGRVYVEEGELSYATTRNDDSPFRQLFEFGVLEDGPPDERRSVDVDEMDDSTKLRDLLEQQLTDVLVRIMTLREGDFGFEEGTVTEQELPGTFEVELVLARAEERASEWHRISEVLPSTNTPLYLNPYLAKDEEAVTLDARSWAIVASVGSGNSAAAVAQQLRVFEFAAAKKISELIRRELVIVEQEAEDVDVQGLAGLGESEESAEPDPGEPAPTPKPRRRAEEKPVPDTEEETQDAPASELARRWRELSSARQRAEA